nr:LacI family DNA-binding transcriptional regulator [Actinopolymorpha pittospori]
MTGAARRVTARDVAARAGVSVTTVSRVLNDKAVDLTPATCERVRVAARELGYQVHPAASALRRGRTGTLGLVVPDIGDQYFHRIARGVEDAIRPQGFGIVFCDTDRDASLEDEAVDMLLSKGVDGIVLCGGGLDDDRHLRSRRWHNTPVVTIGPHRLDFPAISADDVGAVAALVRHLHEGGRRRILCVAGQPTWLVTKQRLVGYHTAVEELGLDDDPKLVVHAGFTAEAGEHAVRQARERGIDFDAVVAFDDYAALGALHALQALGIAVPEDVAVAGCDDIDFARFARVPLTSVRFPTYEMGRAAARLLAPPPGEREEVVAAFGFELHVRESSAPAGRRG